jgi:HSP20 family protein
MTLGDLVPWGRKDRGLALQPRSGAAPSFGGGELSPFVRLHEEMNRLFDDVFRDFGMAGRRSMAAWPQVEISETKEGFRLTAELPGLDEKDIELSLHDGVLTLRGEKTSDASDEARGYSERRYGAFERSLQVGDVDEAKVRATFDKGVLTVDLPRSPAAEAQVKRIAINAPTHH